MDLYANTGLPLRTASIVEKLTKHRSSAIVFRMLRIRLQRVGRKHEPTFRLVLTESTNSTKSGRFLEILGSFDARSEKPQFDTEKIKMWIGRGARVTDTVHNMLLREKVISGKKINVLPKKSPPKAPEAAPATAKSADAPSEAAAPAEVAA